MKIICFLFDGNVGGPHVRARSVYQRLVRDGHAARIALPSGSGNAEAYFGDAGIAVDRLRIRKPVSPRDRWGFALYLLGLPLGVARAFAYLRRARPDVIHVNGAFDLVPAFAGRLAGVPMVWHLNDTAVPPRTARLLGRLVAALATTIVISSPRVAQHHGIAPDRAKIVFPPVDTTRYRARPPDGRPGQPAVIGLIANWNPLKGQDCFVEVIRRLRAEGHDVRARILGHFLESQKEYWQPILDRIEREGLKDEIECPGFVNDPAAMLPEFDLLLVTSRSEAGPMSVLEAMSVGVPQVCFRVGAVDDFLTRHGEDPSGIAVPPGDVDAMIEGIRRLLTDRELYARCARAGQQRARALFSLDACASRHEALYAAAMGRAGIARETCS